MSLTNERSERRVAEPRKDRLVWLVMAVGVLVVVLGVVFMSRFGSDPTIVASPLIGKPAADVVAPFMEEEGSLRLSDLEGDIVVVNFWASWCLSCRVEHEALNAAAADYEGLGVSFVGVQYQDVPARGTAFLDELGRSPHFAYVHDADSRVAVEFGVLGLPETFFIDRQGTIVGKVSGPLNYGLLADTLDSIIVGEAIGEVKTGEVENR